MRAIIMAGGKGKRLFPYTATIPKPLVTIGEGKTILEIIIGQLKNSGFKHVTIAVNHLANMITEYFKDGSRFDIKIDYSFEDKPLHTIGPLTLINDLPENFLVINGDTLTNLNYRDFYDKHVELKNQISVAAKKREVKTDFGVLEFDNNNYLSAFREKPVSYSYVAMGVNCFHKSVIKKISKGQKYGFDNLMSDNLANGQKVWVYDFDGLWLDIGRPEDYQYVNENYEQIKKALCI